ncbi:DUF1173 family protein [Paucibacter sp. PLA-PC-4]|uniref:DUF1173 family protein n=1 Tax=Paucibacter sp. PLA-PC-4 TaxID=2993655 RepID=UPI00224B4784|nr:DUF1173 family protein [Paucibacter sp. PLA-PC-4]
MSAFACAEREPTLEIEGARYAPSSAGFEQAIARAYSRRRRPRCVCTAAGVEMYVARLGDGYIVKRMPDTGSQHAPDCVSFEAPAEISGRRHLLGSAVKEDPNTGMTSLKLDFSLSKRQARITPASPRPPSGTASTAGSKLSLRGLLHLLWDRSALTRWHPGFEGRRSWGTVHRQLLQAAEQMFIRGQTLATRLYVPEPFFVERRDEIIARRRDTWACAVGSGAGRQRLLLLIGEVKEMVPARHGHKAVIKHVPDVAFAMDDSLYRQLPQRFGPELELWSASDSIRMLMIATLVISDAGLPHIVELSLITVTAQWLPVETAAEQYLVEGLVRSQRAFLKLLRYDLHSQPELASLALTDRGAPAPLMFARDCEGTT